MNQRTGASMAAKNSSSASPGVVGALSKMLDAIDLILKEAGYAGEPIRMTLAGGLAVHFYLGSRFTEDVDAEFSRRLLLPVQELVFDYTDADGSSRTLYLDSQYSSTFSLMHEDHDRDAVQWSGIGNEGRLIHLQVLSPVDLALSKVARFGEVDQEDILALADAGLFTASDLRQRADQALAYYVGNTSMARQSVEIICSRIESQARRCSEGHGSS